MRKDRIHELFRQYDQQTQDLVSAVMSIEQEYISFDIKQNNRQLQEIKQKIRQIIDRMQQDETK